MTRTRNIGAALTLMALLAAAAHAEKAPEDKEKAEFVLTGKVMRVYSRGEGRLTEYIVQMSVQEVHKGEGVKKGDAFYIYCFQKSRPLIPVAEPRGHSAVPKEGQVIKAYVHDRAGRHEANYSHWFEVVEVKAEEK